MRKPFSTPLAVVFLSGALTLGAGASVADDKFSTNVDADGRASGTNASSRNLLLDDEAADTPSVVHNSAWTSSAGVTSASDQSQSATNAFNAEAQRVREEADAEVAAVTRTMNSEIDRLEAKISSSTSSSGGGGGGSSGCRFGTAPSGACNSNPGGGR